MTKMDDFVLGVAVVAFSIYGYGLYSSRLASYRGKLGWLASSWPFGKHYERQTGVVDIALDDAPDPAHSPIRKTFRS